MKRIVCSILTLILLLGLFAVANGGGSQSGDVGGVFAKQIEEALKKGIDPATLKFTPLTWKTPTDLPGNADLTAKYGSAKAKAILEWRAKYYALAVGNRGPLGVEIVNWCLANGVDTADVLKQSVGVATAKKVEPIQCCPCWRECVCSNEDKKAHFLALFDKAYPNSGLTDDEKLQFAFDNDDFTWDMFFDIHRYLCVCCDFDGGSTYCNCPAGCLCGGWNNPPEPEKCCECWRGCVCWIEFQEYWEGAGLQAFLNWFYNSSGYDANDYSNDFDTFFNEKGFDGFQGFFEREDNHCVCCFIFPNNTGGCPGNCQDSQCQCICLKK